MAVDENPYAAPSVEPSNPAFLPQRRSFPDLRTKELKKLRNDSHSLRAMAVLLILGAIAAGLFLLPAPSIRLWIGVTLLMILNLGTAWALLSRPAWGRHLGFPTAVLMLFFIPVGTIFAPICMIALARGARLFGPQRFLHHELEAEWKYRHKLGIH
ncbi:hypothetical protein [Haloferula rosea]|uniref:SxtJ n=1 Tax=Haloferula rosea TaxID=490093 RepID=A0A934RF74_9BACT|nr:hypothetical protein [Haloferula rosea]MBK1827436.1 hypothetical protein [Haloferula rosea]